MYSKDNKSPKKSQNPSPVRGSLNESINSSIKAHGINPKDNMPTDANWWDRPNSGLKDLQKDGAVLAVSMPTKKIRDKKK